MLPKQKFLSAVEIRDGEYTGKVSGYLIELEVDEKLVYYELAKFFGVRGMNIPCKFKVLDGLVDEASVVFKW